MAPKLMGTQSLSKDRDNRRSNDISTARFPIVRFQGESRDVKDHSSTLRTIKVESLRRPLVTGLGEFLKPPSQSGKLDCVNIYTRGIHGISFGTVAHSMAHVQFSIHLTDHLGVEIPEADEEELYNGLVAGFRINRGGQLVVRLRPDCSAEQLLAAMQVLAWSGVLNNQVEFSVGSSSRMEEVKRLGALHKIESIARATPAEKGVFIHSRLKRTEAGNRFYYVETRGERLLTVEQAEALLNQTDNRDDLLIRLQEITKGYESRSLTAPGRDIDFLLVGDDFERKTDTAAIAAHFENLRDLVEQSKSWTPKALHRFELEAEKCLEAFRSATHELFRHDNHHRAQWVTQMFRYVADMPRGGLAKQLSPEYTGLLEPLPGGFIGYRLHRRQLRLGAEAVSLEQVGAEHFKTPKNTDLFIKKAESQGSRTGYISLAPHGPKQSSQVIELRQEDQWALRRQFIFDPEASQETRDLLNEVLERYKAIEYAYVCAVPESLSSRDMLIDSLQQYWTPPRRVQVVGVKPVEGNEIRQLVRRSAYPTYFWQYLYKGGMPREDAQTRSNAIGCFMHLQRCILREWGVKVPQVKVVELHETVEKLKGRDLNWQSIRVEHYVRDFICGTAINRINRVGHPCVDFAMALIGLKGRMAAVNLAARRRYFADGDEIVSSCDDKDYPREYYLADPTSAFPSKTETAGAPPSADLPLYAIHLAADLVGAEYTFRNTKDLIGNKVSESGSETRKSLKQCFIVNFKTELARIKNYSVEHELELLDLVDQSYFSLPELPPEFDMRSCLEQALADLSEMQVETIGSKLEGQIDDLILFYSNLIDEVDIPDDVEDVLDAAELLLASSWEGRNGVCYQDLQKIILQDFKYSSLSSKERILRLQFLHAVAWAVQQGLAVEGDLLPLAEEIRLRKGSDNEVEVTDAELFVQEVQDRFGELGFQARILREFFKALYVGEAAEWRYLELRKSGYFLSSNRV